MQGVEPRGVPHNPSRQQGRCRRRRRRRRRETPPPLPPAACPHYDGSKQVVHGCCRAVARPAVHPSGTLDWSDSEATREDGPAHRRAVAANVQAAKGTGTGHTELLRWSSYRARWIEPGSIKIDRSSIVPQLLPLLGQSCAVDGCSCSWFAQRLALPARLNRFGSSSDE